MAVHKTTSTFQIIAKLRREFNPSGTAWIGDVAEYIGDAILAIGHHSGFEAQYKRVQSENFRCPYPNGFDQLIGIEYKHTRLPIGGQRQDNIHRHRIISADNPVNNFFYPLVNLENQNEEKVNVRTLPTTIGAYYIPYPDYLITSFECDWFTMYYNGIPIDELGLPKVPDTFNHKECITYFCMMKLLSNGYTHPVFSFWDTKKLFDEYLPKAQGTANYPTIDELERFKNMWVRLIPDENLCQRFFENVNPEIVRGI